MPNRSCPARPLNLATAWFLPSPDRCLTLCICRVCVVQGVPGSPKAAVQVSVYADIGIGRGDKPGLDWYQQYGATAVRNPKIAALLPWSA